MRPYASPPCPLQRARRRKASAFSLLSARFARPS
jgi:hypothetical protein